MANFQDLRSEALLLVVDFQPKFLSAMWESQRVHQATLLLAKSADLLGIPVIVTEQNPGRMGLTDPDLQALAQVTFPKMEFSAWGDLSIRGYLENQSRRTIILVGLETHICIALTARDLKDAGFDVIVCPDAVTAGSMDRHKIGMELIRDSGILPAHTESLIYGWLRTAEDPAFRTILGYVKDGRNA